MLFRSRNVPIPPTPTPGPRGNLPRIVVGQGFPHQEGFIPDGSHILFAGGAGRNEREGRIKDMERDLGIQEKMEKLQERMRNRGRSAGGAGGARPK